MNEHSLALQTHNINEAGIPPELGAHNWRVGLQGEIHAGKFPEGQEI